MAFFFIYFALTTVHYSWNAAASGTSTTKRHNANLRKGENDTQMNRVHDNNINCWLLVEFFKMEIDNGKRQQPKQKHWNAKQIQINGNEKNIFLHVSYEHLACHMLYKMTATTYSIQSTFKIAIKVLALV